MGRERQFGQAEREAFLRSVTLFQDLGDDVLRFLAGQSRHCVFRSDEMIFYQGDEGSACHIIMGGRVRIFVMGDDGRELSMRILGPGEIFGEMALFENLPRSASVEALEHTHTLVVHQDDLIRSLQRSPKLALALLRSLSARLRYATEEAESLASLTVTERLTWRLERLAELFGRPAPGGVRIGLPMTQQELAALVGTSRESINRSLVRLRREGKVRVDGGWIVLLDDEGRATEG